MDSHPHWGHDESRHLMEEMEQLIASGESGRKASEILHIKYPSHTSSSIRNKFLRYKESGGRSHGNQIFTDSEIEEIIGCLEAWSLANRGLCKSFVVEHLGRMRDVEGWNARSWLDDLIASQSDRLKLIPTVSKDPSRVTNEVK